MIQATEGIGTPWLLDLCNGIVKEGCIPKDWKGQVTSVLLSLLVKEFLIIGQHLAKLWAKL